MDPKITRALLSVSDKSGLAAFARGLSERGVELISTGGTAKALTDAGLAVQDVAEITGFPEMMDGRIKTLHPKIHGGLLSVRGNPRHAEAQRLHGIANIDLLVVNLYPFEAAVARGDSYAECVENIDIGGPAMIRAGAKNHASVLVVIAPTQYDAVLDEMDAHAGGSRAETRAAFARDAFSAVAAYDTMIAGWLSRETKETAPAWRGFSGKLAQPLRYGENPHQWAAFYRTADPRPGVATARQLQGKELSYNNLNDADAAFELVAEFDPSLSAAVAIVKHANPCGVASRATLLDAYESALRCDPVSAFGGVVALNRPLDAGAASVIAEIFTEVIVAPDASEGAIAILARRKNLRLLLTGALPDPAAPGTNVRSVAGGLLVQARDNGMIDQARLEVVTRRSPTEREMADLKFAFRVVKHVKSNAIVYARDGATVGIGAGQMNRRDSSRIAAIRAQEAAEADGLTESLAQGSVIASDAFFPFPDGMLAAADAGATAIIQPGGSMRDAEVIEAADARGLAIVFTGMRHFRH